MWRAAVPAVAHVRSSALNVHSCSGILRRMHPTHSRTHCPRPTPAHSGSARAKGKMRGGYAAGYLGNHQAISMAVRVLYAPGGD
jgi:hypothetical protein